MRRFHEQVVVVGGGPAGLAAAVMLARRGWRSIVVLESRRSANHHEPDRSYNYLIDGRGQRLTDMMGLADQLSRAGVSSSDLSLTVVEADGRKRTRRVPFFFGPSEKPSYWIPRP